MRSACRPTGPVEQELEQVERLCELEAALLDPSLDVAGGALENGRLESAVGKTRARRAHIDREAGCSCGGPGRAQPLGVGGGDDADVRQAVLERRVEEQLVQPARRLLAQ